ncbi:MAG: phosphate signaling complex PhoU family protein, partial [Candidatus Enterenecus sp.]
RDIAEIIPLLEGRAVDHCQHIGEMAKAAIKMVTESVDAYVKRDVELARQVKAYDDVVDDYFCKVKDSLIQQVAGNPMDGEYILDLLMIAKYFERIGDHAVNIAEWVVFSVTGAHKEEQA